MITLGALAGLTSVMLVMLLGQTRVLYAMANDGLLPRKFFAAIHPKFRTPCKNTILVGCWRPSSAASRPSTTSARWSTSARCSRSSSSASP